MKHDKPPEEHHKPSEKRLVSGEIKIHGAMQVFDTPDTIDQHKTERAEDNSYKDSTKNFEKSYLRVVKVTAVISFLYLVATILIFLQSKRAADAAKQAANTAQQQLEASQGASINFNVIVSGPFVFDSNGIKLQTTVNYRNIGHSQAVEMRRGMEFLPLPIQLPDILSERDKICNEAWIKTRVDEVFPGDELSENWTLSIDKAKVDEALKLKGFLHPTLLFCITYRSSFSDQRHQTAKILDLHSNEQRTAGFFLKPEESITIPQQFLGFLPHPESGIHTN